MKLRAVLGFVCVASMMLGNSLAVAQSVTVTKEDLQGSLDKANAAATTQDLPGTLPGYQGDAPELQGLYSKTPDDLSANGTAVGAANGQTGLMSSSSTYKSENAIDPNADWVRNALNIETDPQGTAQGVGDSTSSCSSQTQTSTSNTHSLYTCEEGTKVTTSSYACSTTTTASSGYACTKSWVDGQSALVSSSACNTLSSTSGCTQTGQTCTTASTYQSASYNCYVGNSYSTATSTCYANWVDGKTPLQPDATCTAKAADSTCSKTAAVCVTPSTYESSSYSCYVGNSYSTTTSTCGLSFVDGKATLQADATCTARAADSTCSKTGAVCTTPSTYQNASYNCYKGNTYSSATHTCSTSHSYSSSTYYQYISKHDVSGRTAEGATKAIDWCLYTGASGSCGKTAASNNCSGPYAAGGQSYFYCPNPVYGSMTYAFSFTEGYQSYIDAGCTVTDRQADGVVNGTVITERYIWSCPVKVGTASPTATTTTYTDNGASSTCGSYSGNSSCSKTGTTCTQYIDPGVAAYYGLSTSTCVASTDTYTCTTSTPVNYCDAGPSGTGWSCSQSGTSYQSSGGVSNAITVTSYSCTKEIGVNGCKAETDTYSCTVKTPVNYCDPAPTGTGWSCSKSGTRYQASGGVSNAITVTDYSCSKEDGVNGCKKEQDTYSCTTTTPVNYCDPAPTGSGWSCSQSGTSYQSSGGVNNAITVKSYSCSKENGVNGCKVETDTYVCNNPVSGAGNATSYTETTNNAAERPTLRKGLEAEERIRAKVVAHLRAAYPGCRIIHELKLDYSKCRLDVAAVTDRDIVVVEIKSEKDSLKRLGPQIKSAFDFGTESWLVMNEAMYPVLDACSYIEEDGSVRVPRNSYIEAEIAKAKPFLGRAAHLAQDESKALSESLKLIEQANSDVLVEKVQYRDKRGKWRYYGGPGDLLKALWVAEMREICHRHSINIKANAPTPDVRPAILMALSGDQLIREVCRALRARPFARADAAIAETASIAA